MGIAGRLPPAGRDPRPHRGRGVSQPLLCGGGAQARLRAALLRRGHRPGRGAPSYAREKRRPGDPGLLRVPGFLPHHPHQLYPLQPPGQLPGVDSAALRRGPHPLGRGPAAQLFLRGIPLPQGLPGLPAQQLPDPGQRPAALSADLRAAGLHDPHAHGAEK